METTSTAKASRRPAYIAVIAVVALVAVALVAMGRDSGPPVIRLGSAPAADATAEAMSDDMEMGRAFGVDYEFVLADSARFPAGEAAAWRLEPPSDMQAATAELAGRLGLDGAAASSPYGDGSWYVGPVDGSGPSLWVGPSGDWSYSDPAAMVTFGCPDRPMSDEPLPVEPDEGAGGADEARGGGVSGSEGAADQGPATDAAEARGSDDPRESPERLDGLDGPYDCEPEAPTGIPSDAEARSEAEAFFSRVMTTPPTITEVYSDEWGAWVTATLPLGSTQSDVHLSVGFGPDAVVNSANGTFSRPVETDRYPTIDADRAVERLQEQHAWLRDGMEMFIDPPMEDDGEVTILPAPGPGEEPETVTVTLVAAEPLAMLVIDEDQTFWLLPGVRFTDDEGATWQVLTVADEYLDTEDTSTDTPMPAPEPGTVDPGRDGTVGPGEEPPPEPAPAPGEPGEPDDARAQATADEVVGMAEDDAITIIEERGLTARIVVRDGEHAIVTDDYRTDRVNLEIEDGVVVAASVG